VNGRELVGTFQLDNHTALDQQVDSLAIDPQVFELYG
jgi:hypothetical protein